jgi:hypothetical protein
LRCQPKPKRRKGRGGGREGRKGEGRKERRKEERKKTPEMEENYLIRTQNH